MDEINNIRNLMEIHKENFVKHFEKVEDATAVGGLLFSFNIK